MSVLRDVCMWHEQVAMIPATPLDAEAIVFDFVADVVDASGGAYLRNDFLRFVERHATLPPLVDSAGGSLPRDSRSM